MKMGENLHFTDLVLHRQTAACVSNPYTHTQQRTMPPFLLIMSFTMSPTIGKGMLYVELPSPRYLHLQLVSFNYENEQLVTHVPFTSSLSFYVVESCALRFFFVSGEQTKYTRGKETPQTSDETTYASRQIGRTQECIVSCDGVA